MTIANFILRVARNVQSPHRDNQYSTVLYGYSADALWFFNMAVVTVRKLPLRTYHCINYYKRLVNNSATGRVLGRTYHYAPVALAEDDDLIRQDAVSGVLHFREGRRRHRSLPIGMLDFYFGLD